MASSISEFTETHTFVSGIILLAVGLVGVYGAVSGNLASMLAALFEPTDLYTVDTSKLNPTPGVPGKAPSGGDSGGGGGGGGSGTPSTPELPGGQQPQLPTPNPPELGPGGLPEIAA